METKIRPTIPLILAILAGTTLLRAQGTSAAISGTVTDSSGAVIVDTKIALKNVNTGIIQATTSDAQGRYRVPDLPAGVYEETASKTGFSTVIHAGIVLTVGSFPVVDLSMLVGKAQETIMVKGEVSSVETTSTAMSNLVESTQMRELPLNGRNFSQLLTLAPGVVGAAPSTESFSGTQTMYSISGARPEGQAFLLDNSDIQDWWNHGSGSSAVGTSLGLDAIGEFQMLTNTYGPQFGGNGSVVNAVSKSGNNRFHGSGYEFLRNSDLDARNFFDGASAPEFRRNQFGGTVGGPIKKNRAFFFVNYEGLRSSLGQTQIAFVPDANARKGYLPCSVASRNACNTATGLAYAGISPAVASTLALYPQTNSVTSTGVAQVSEIASQVAHENYMFARMDYTFSDKDSLLVRYVLDRANQLSPFSSTTIPLWPELDTTANHFATIQERHFFSPAVINLAQVSFNRPNENGSTTGQTSPLNYWPGSGWQDGAVMIGGLAQLGPNDLLPFSLIQNKFAESDDVIWTHGSHGITIGASVNRQQDNGSGPVRQSGLWDFTSLLSAMQDKPTSFIGGIPGRYDATRSIRELMMAFYGNDSWKVTSRLTLNLGLRYEPATNPTEVFGNYHTFTNPPFNFAQVPHFWEHNPATKNFAPRLGLAYDPFNDHKTSIRSGFGMYYDALTARVIGSCTFGTFPAQTYAQVRNFNYPVPLSSIESSPPSVSPACDYTLKGTPYMMQYNLNVQRDLGDGTILTVGYVGSRGVRLLQGRDENAPIPLDGNLLGPYSQIIDGDLVVNPRPDPAFSTVALQKTDGYSRYNSLQLALKRTLTRNWQGQFSYTLSHSVDTASAYWGEGGGYPGGAAVPLDVNLDKGTSSFNRKNVVVANSVYLLPFSGSKLIEGWQISGILTAESGNPITVTNGIDQEWTPQNAAERPNYIAGCNWHVGLVNEWYNPKCFSLPAVGMIGNLGRSSLVGPGLTDVDFSLMKDTKIPKISEFFDVQLRAEFFNIVNHPNFGLPTATNFVTGATVGTGRISSQAGVITTTATTSRQIQFGLKILF
jgi:hypothetical protein